MEKLKVYNPYTRDLLEEIPLQEWNTIDQCISRASQLLKLGGPVPKWKRVQILETLGELFKQHFDTIVQIAVSEGGKPLKDTIIEVKRAMQGIKLSISNLESMAGEVIPMGHTENSQNRTAYTKLEPVGVVLAISAFNHPVNLIIHQVVTAIAVGAPVMVKPALKTPLSCKYVLDLIYEAGLPVDWCQMILCKNELSEKMAADKRISYVSFIGSHKVGWHLRSILAPGTKIMLEHGGVAPLIIEKDASLLDLIPGLTKGAYYHAGQVCVSVQRIFIHESILEEFLHLFLPSVKALKCGDPAKIETDVGPIILPIENDRINRWVKDAVSEGGKIILGGNKLSEVLFEPTIIFKPADYSYVSTEEIFGPVVSVYTFNDKHKLLKKVNKPAYSFQASVYTKNLDLASYYSKRINANTVLINDHSAFRVDWMPFGGSQLAGLGVGGIKYSMKDMCKEKLIIFNNGGI